MNAWFLSVRQNDIDTVKQLMRQFKQTQNKLGDTALIIAARRGQLNMVKVLAELEAGTKNKNGLTAIDEAFIAKNMEVIDFLSEYEVLQTDKIQQYKLSGQASVLAEENQDIKQNQQLRGQLRSMQQVALNEKQTLFGINIGLATVALTMAVFLLGVCVKELF